MASEARRAATALVEHRTERFESLHPLDESQRRLREAMERAKPEGRVLTSYEWDTGAKLPVLVVSFTPPPRTQQFLKGVSIGMVLLMAACAWALLAPGVDSITQWMITLFTVLTILGLPFVFVALGSNREAEESRLRRAIRAALVDEGPNLPPQQRWKDED